jgi:2-oxoglutarate ferredoxin oxidoreductase subunit alpha
MSRVNKARVRIDLKLYVFTKSEHPSLIRGGHNALQVRISKEEVYSHSENINMLVALNYETVEKHIKELQTGGAIIFDPDDST